jgi:hypothetical protein
MILTIDVGLKNLAMCIMGCENKFDMKTYKIYLWDVFNTLEEESESEKCKGIMKNGKVCNKKCSYKYINKNLLDEQETIYTCKAHFPKTVKITQRNKVSKKKVADFLLQDICRIILTKIKYIYAENIEMFVNVNKVLIELQPRVNNKMKLVSHLIYGKFVELYEGTTVPIRFVRAAQKLKAYKGPMINCHLKGAYAKRKWLSIQYTKWFLENEFCDNYIKESDWLKQFNDHSKKDDLGDVFLMAINDLKINMYKN